MISTSLQYKINATQGPRIWRLAEPADEFDPWGRNVIDMANFATDSAPYPWTLSGEVIIEPA